MERFAFELRKLRQEADGLTYRAMARSAHYSVTVLSQAAAGTRLPSLTVTLAYVRACRGDPVAWERRWKEARDAVAAAERSDDGLPSPYQGLARFEPDDHHKFFGRDALVARAKALLDERRFAAVVGPSGSGKSSLLRAGLTPALRSGGRNLAAIRILTPGERPLATHVAALKAAEEDAETVVVVDQFEEIFTLCRSPDERAEFIDRLLTARDPGSGLRVLIAVRADFYGRCAEHRALADTLPDCTLLVGPMSPAELNDAIVRPAQTAGLMVERKLSARLIDEVKDEPGSLPLLSHVLLETWLRRRGRVLTVEAYEAAGGLHGAIAHTAESLHTQLTAPQRQLARLLLLRLITPGEGTPDTRRPASRSEFGLTTDSGDIDQVLDKLARARLITLDDGTVDIAHEALITGWPRLHGWIEESRERLRCHRRLTEAARTWQELDQDPGALYRGTRLATTQEHFPQAHHHPELISTERAFLNASTTARHQEQQAEHRNTRRLRRFAGAVSVLLVLALTAGVLAWQQSRTSDRQSDRALEAQRVAQSRQLAARSDALLTSDPDLGSLLAIHAHRTSPTPEAASSLYSAAGLPIRHRLSGHADEVSSVVFSPDGRTLATGGDEGAVRLWNTANGKAYASITAAEGMSGHVAFSPDSKIVASSDAASVVRLWDVASGESRSALTGHTGGIAELEFSPDGRTLATGGGDGKVLLWNAARGTTRTVLNGHTGSVTGLVFSPDGLALATGDDDNTLRLWDVASGKARTHITERTDTAAFSPDGRTMATGDFVGVVRLWDTASGTVRETLPGHTDMILDLAFGPDGRTLATGSADETARLWDITTRGERTVRAGHPTDHTTVISPDGQTLATAGRYGDESTVHLWDAASGKPRASLTGHIGRVRAVAFSPDGKTLATSADDTTVRLWDTGHAQVKETLTGLPRPVALLMFSPDGRTLATAVFDKTLRLWNTASGTQRASLTGHTGNVTATAFSPDGRTVATTADDKSLRLWDTELGIPRATYPINSAEATAVAFHPDGRTLSVAGEGKAQHWRTDLPTLSRSVRKICNAIHRNLTRTERATYLPESPARPACTA
ncbi:helix-turn-helix domain-containing protein [Streptomyces sp. p1417]|uniref:Helix-turn-helix domain-containing protein n=1 Tax=Streptomyces typhae TaxID=2681492 RepID=A0A6L6WT55_9ACTN|nr:helix-turn-helix domain-containing protein [Streptomyces typhae]